MGTFSTLLRLGAQRQSNVEDFTTELLASVFRRHPVIARTWLEEIGVSVTTDDAVQIETQLELEQIQGHQHARRPDMVLRVLRGSGHSTIFLEAKIAAGEGLNQLRDYAEHLARVPSAQRILVYLTRNSDTKDADAILSRCPPGAIVFRPYRWSAVYELLSSHRSDPLIEEVCTFMEEQRLNLRSRFAPADFVAMAGFANARSVMDQTLDRDVELRFQQALGKPKKRSTMMTFLRYWDQYILYNDHSHWLTGVGYFLEPWRVSEYPSAGVMLRVSHKNHSRVQIEEFVRKELVEGLRGWEARFHPQWGGHTQFFKVRPLSDFMGAADHVQSVRQFFLETIDEVSDFRTAAELGSVPITWIPRDNSGQQTSTDESDEQEDDL
jgi:hypothetical protein